MSEIAAGVSQMQVSTLRNRRRGTADLVTKSNALLTRLKTRGNTKTFPGGRDILWSLQDNENRSFTRYSGDDELDIRPSRALTGAAYDLKQAAISVVMTGLEMIQNRGKAAVIDLLGQKIKAAERTFTNRLAADVYSDGMADNGRQIGGLRLLVPLDPTTGTAGGINRASATFWRNQTKTIASLAGNNGADLTDAMLEMYLNLCRGMDKPDLFIGDNAAYMQYYKTLEAKERYSKGDNDLAKGGWQALQYQGADVIADGNQGGFAPERTFYVLNTNYLHWQPARGRDMEPMEPRQNVAQDASVTLILWAGNLTMNGAQFQGIIRATGA